MKVLVNKKIRRLENVTSDTVVVFFLVLWTLGTNGLGGRQFRVPLSEILWLSSFSQGPSKIKLFNTTLIQYVLSTIMMVILITIIKVWSFK